MAVFTLRGWDLSARIIIPLPRAPTASGPQQSQQQQPQTLGKSHPEPQGGL